MGSTARRDSTLPLGSLSCEDSLHGILMARYGLNGGPRRAYGLNGGPRRAKSPKIGQNRPKSGKIGKIGKKGVREISRFFRNLALTRQKKGLFTRNLHEKKASTIPYPLVKSGVNIPFTKNTKPENTRKSLIDHSFIIISSPN